MKLDKHHNAFEAFGEKTTIKFGIDAENMGLVYKSFLHYSNPIGSVVREYTSNCFDSHAEAGVDAPITIKMELGNTLTGKQANIQFIDYGVGLSPDRVENVFAKFFTSTKRETNTQIGGFGIGAKSALGYTDMFTIITNFNGAEYTYVVHAGETSPEMDLINTQPTINNNGTTIKVDIKDGDYYTFQSEIKKQLKYFDNIEFINCDVNPYELLRQDNYIYRTGSSDNLDISIGKVRYPIDTSVISVIHDLFIMPIGLHFDIGELKVVWNRESIEYNNETKEKLQNAVNNLYKFIVEEKERQSEKIGTLKDFFKIEHKESFKMFDIDMRTKIGNTNPQFELKNDDGDKYFLPLSHLKTMRGRVFQGLCVLENGAKLNRYNIGYDVQSNEDDELEIVSSFKHNTKPVLGEKAKAKATWYHTNYNGNRILLLTKHSLRSFLSGLDQSDHWWLKQVYDFYAQIEVEDYEVEYTDEENQAYKEYLASKRVTKKRVKREDIIFHKISNKHSGTYQSVIRYPGLHIYGSKQYEDILKNLCNLQYLNTHYSFGIVSKENEQILLEQQYPIAMHVTDFVKSKYIRKLAQNYVDWRAIWNTSIPNVDYYPEIMKKIGINKPIEEPRNNVHSHFSRIDMSIIFDESKLPSPSKVVQDCIMGYKATQLFKQQNPIFEFLNTYRLLITPDNEGEKKVQQELLDKIKKDNVAFNIKLKKHLKNELSKDIRNENE